MDSKYILTIAVLTMNRKEQVIEALSSCISSNLPVETEFVIIDNHSLDGTEEKIRNFFGMNGMFSFQYEYENENLGVGGGRSRAFDLSRGKYIYFLDDDAVISDDSKDIFFKETIEFLEKNVCVASITTRIEDTILKGSRNDNISPYKIDGRPMIYKFLGGSHFLRKSAFDSPLYFSIKYGSEEFAPSITVQDRGFVHVYFDNIYVIHKPVVNKWIKGSAYMEYVLIQGIAVAYATKLMLYPRFFFPILGLAYICRCCKYLKCYKGAISKSNKLVKEIIRTNKYNKIRISTVIKMKNRFGLTVF